MRAHPVLSAAVGDRRRRLLSAARGLVVDVGGFVDNGPHYPPGVEVHDVSVDELGSLPASSFDTLVCTLVLCTAPAPLVLAEARRVLRENGRLLFLEHVRGGGGHRLLQRASSPVWSRVFDGCSPDRDTVAAVRAAGFLITDLERFSFRPTVPIISPGVQGMARVASSR